jgi:hypothetical protein
METKVLTYKEPKINQSQSKSLTYYVQRIEELQVIFVYYLFAFSFQLLINLIILS